MFRRPELGRNQDQEPPTDRGREIVLQAGRVVTGIGFIGTALIGLDSLVDNHHILNTIVEQTGNVPTSLGAMILEWRAQGFSDEIITAGILGLAGIFLAGHIVATSTLNRSRRRP